MTKEDKNLMALRKALDTRGIPVSEQLEVEQTLNKMGLASDYLDECLSRSFPDESIQLGFLIRYTAYRLFSFDEDSQNSFLADIKNTLEYLNAMDAGDIDAAATITADMLKRKN